MSASLPTYSELREQGIAHITRLAQQYWTDHNASDPGITLLEQLCYALTDLGYRIDFDMPDHLAAGGENAYSALFSSRQILATEPVTFDDFRHSLIDLLGVKNADIKENPSLGPDLLFAPFSGELLLAKDKDGLLPEDLYQAVQLKGLWEVNAEAIRNNLGNLLVPDLHEQLYTHLQVNRTLCTDFAAIAVFDRQAVRIRLGIELGEGVSPEQLLADVYEVLDQYISPSLNFQALSTMLEDFPIEEVFDGPALARGFLKKTDIQQFKKRDDLRRSDLIHAIKRMGPQVKAVREMNFALGSDPYVNPAPWITALNAEQAAFFEIDTSDIFFYRGNLLVEVDKSKAKQLFEAKKTLQINQQIGSLEPDAILGTDRQTEHYSSVRGHMPELYGLSSAGLPPQAELAQQASARQLSAYLLFFEQMLANGFSQLANAWKLFSVDRTDSQSYFIQSLDNLPALNGIYVENDPLIRSAGILQNTENTALAEARTEKFLDHLLARFAESMTDYSLLMSGISHPEAERSEVIADKRSFLQQYPALSAGRGAAFDYTASSWMTENISGLKKRIAKKLGIDDLELGSLLGGKEGFFLLEHLLLRPRPGDAFQEHALLAGLNQTDPYSLQLSFIFPEDAGRYAGLSVEKKGQFKSFVEQLIRNETPAHIRLSVYWLSPPELVAFEIAYEAFLEALAAEAAFGNILTEAHQYRLRIARDEILDVLAQKAGKSLISGIPYPLRDVPLSEEVIAQAVGNPPTSWAADIQLFYPQKGVTYVLTDRNRRPLSPRIAVSGNVPTGTNAQGTPFLIIPTPTNLSEDQTFWIRAEKEMLGKTNFVYLKARVRVLIGIAAVMSEAIPPEIDYGQQVSVQLTGTQAGVDYQLYDGSTVISIAPVAGDPLNPILLATQVSGGFTEDLTIMVRGSRDSFASVTDVGSVNLRVRANPNLRLAISSTQVSYNGNVASVEVESDGSGNITQASVTYRLMMQEVADRDFVHQKALASQPPAAEVLELVHAFGTAKIQGISLADWPVAQPSFGEVATGTVSSDGDSLLINTSSIDLAEDSRFVVLASKPGHTDPVILHDPLAGQLFMQAALVAPDSAPALLLSPSPVASGTRARVEISNTQPGVKYFLRIGGVDQPAVFHHDTNSLSPRFDGIGNAKVGVDSVIGPPVTLPLAAQTRDPINATISADVIAEKIQTGLQITLGTISLSVV